MPCGVPGSADRVCLTRASGPARFPCSVCPLRNQTRAASSPDTRAEHPALPGARNAAGRHIGITRRGSPQVRICQGRPYATRGAAPGTAGRPAPRNGNPHAVPPCVPQRGRTVHTTPAAWVPCARELREIHPPAQAPPRAADRNAHRRYPPGTPGSRGTRVPARAAGSAPQAKPKWAPRGPCPWPSVESRRCTPTVLMARTPSAYLHRRGDRKWFRDGPFTVLGRASLCSLALIAAGSCERAAGSGGAKRPRSGAAGALEAAARERIMAGGGKGANRGVGGFGGAGVGLSCRGRG